MEEGFNYPAGTALAANPPWAGSLDPSVGVVNGNLALTNLQDATPSGNMLQAGGGSGVAFRNFSASPIPDADGIAVYFSALIQCTQPPTNSQFIASLLEAGVTSPSPPDDPFDLYATPGVGGWRLSITHAGSDRSTARTVLMTNTTHLIVMKYTFGSNDFVSLYIDPPPGGLEPAFPDAQADESDDDEGEGGGNGDAANLQVILFRSPGLASQARFNLDTLRAGTNWADVTPVISAPSVTGPQNQEVCSGDPAIFSVTASAIPPFSYQWRTNGVAIEGATNDTYVLLNPIASDALNSYDAVVTDMFGSVTSQVASLAISHIAPSISIFPSNQMVIPGVTNVTFSVSVSGDPPMSFQWRTNGIPIPGATNDSYTTTNLGPADATNVIDVMASNPCGSITSTPPVGLYFPTLFFPGNDAGAGFFGGENLIFTNTSGISFSVWSSPDPTVSVTKWTLEGPMSELPLGTSGESRYGINLNPVTSPVYYIFAESNLGPYPPTQWVTWLTTPDFATYYVTSANVGITPDGILEFPVPPSITQQPQSRAVLAGQNASFEVTASGFGLGYQWFFNNTGISAPSDPVLGLTHLSVTNSGAYFVIVTNSLGAATSSVVTLGVTMPPALEIGSALPGTVQLTADAITNLTYVILSATNLVHPVWVPVLTNNTGLSGLVSVETNTTDAPLQFYRLFFPSAFPLPPQFTQQPQSLMVLAGQNRAFTVSANDPGAGYQWFFNSNGLAGASAPVLALTNIAAANAGTYIVIVTNSLGSVTSSVATLTVALPPALNLGFGAAGTVQLTADSITDLTYVVQSTTNLANPAWVSILTNNTGNGGLVNFQTNTAGVPAQFYRLVFP